jgi:uncharacterized protein YheU (UPF0270 family)
MSHTLKPGTKSHKSHKSLEQIRARKVESVLRNAVLLHDGSKKTIDAMTDDEFRHWFYGLIERVVKTLKPTDTSAKVVIASVQKDSCGLPLDDVSRWYLVDRLNATKAFQNSGIELFVSQEISA